MPFPWLLYSKSSWGCISHDPTIHNLLICDLLNTYTCGLVSFTLIFLKVRTALVITPLLGNTLCDTTDYVYCVMTMDLKWQCMAIELDTKRIKEWIMPKIWFTKGETSGSYFHVPTRELCFILLTGYGVFITSCFWCYMRLYEWDSSYMICKTKETRCHACNLRVITVGVNTKC